MKNQTQKAISLLLVLVQLFVLFPVLQPQAEAAQSDQETPVLNKTIVGTVKFQSFNFLGDNAAGIDGTDYQSTYYYTDDYFAPSAVNSGAAKQVENWTALDNPSLAACSMDFAVASYTSAEGDVISASSRTWDNSDYSNKDKNVKAFLSACGFENIEPHGLTVKPTMDSIGYTLASKPITVWDEATQTNKSCTLVAVGVRGAGYGPEWASNVTIGTAGQGASVVRHKGFDDGAQTVCAGIRSFLAAHSITGDVKYWVCGFSRAAAVANLAAGYLTDNPGVYHTSIDDVYGYTYECPQAASTSENALNYKNIHNIVNPLDAVPKVSPTGFRHQRLGVDYLMPYYKNAGNQNTTYYNRMFEVLKTIAVGNGREADHLISDIQNYPYNGPLPIYTMTATQLIADAIDGNLMTNFGTERAETGWLGNVDSLLGGGQWYMDDFIDNLIDVFLTSTAWDRDYTGSTSNVITHRTRFIDNYQEDFRVALGYLIDYSGPAFLVLIDKVLGAVGNSLGISDAGMGLAFLNFYNDPKGSYASYNIFVDRSWRGKPKKDVLITEAQSKVVEVVTNMTSGYSHATITKSRLDQALRHITAVVIDLYADELDRYDAQYFGTSLHWLWTILATHEQETVLSWIMSLDQNHMNRSCRTVMVPRAADAALHEYRAQYAQYDGSPEDVTSAAPVVASWENGVWTSKDDRITYTASGDYLFIRYPASLQIRTDVEANGSLNLSGVAMDDYMTTSEAVNVSAGADQFVSALPSSGSGDLSGYRYITTSTRYTNANAKNNLLAAYGALERGDVLHILANGTTAYNGTTSYDLIVDKAPQTTIVEYGTAEPGLTGGSSASAVQLSVDTTVSTTTDTVRGIPTRQTKTAIPAASVYFDDDFRNTDLTGSPGDTIFSSVAATLDVDGATQYWYEFTGSRIDVYCTTYDHEGTGEAAVKSGYVQAKVLAADKQTVVDSVTIKNQSDVVRYNVPTIRFDGLTPGETYYLVLNVLKSSHYKLDGIRVYNAVADQSAYDGTTEQYAAFINLRDALVNNESAYDAFTHDVMTGALYVDDTEQFNAQQQQINPETGELTTPFEAYKANSPKSEIYLAKNQAIAFTLTETALQEGTCLWVGLSAPDAGKNTGTVTISGVQQPVTSAVDTYYEITDAMIGTGSTVTIQNTTDNLIAVTNLKVTGNEDIYEAANTQPEPTPGEAVRGTAEAISLVFEPVTIETVKLAAQSAANPEPPAETPDLASVIRQLISSFVQSLFDSISRLFAS